MLSAQACLAKASEMEACAATCATLSYRAEFLDAAMRWRDLARRAWIHEHNDKPGGDPPSPDNSDPLTEL